MEIRILGPLGTLHAWPVQAPHAHARVTGLRVAAAYEVPGVVRVLTADDVPNSIPGEASVAVRLRFLEAATGVVRGGYDVLVALHALKSAEAVRRST